MRHCAPFSTNPVVRMARLSRVLVLFVLASLCAGCGFKLRQDVAWRADWQPLSITAPDPVSALKQQLELRLRQQDVQLVETNPRAVLAIRRETLSRDVLSVDERARVSEYVLTLDVEFDLTVDGKQVLAPTIVRFNRDYDFDELQALGAAQEEELIANELRRDVVRRMLEQIGRISD
jgi:outer membrane lipopolysaccharide assembly protein LptE/RlpB